MVRCNGCPPALQSRRAWRWGHLLRTACAIVQRMCSTPKRGRFCQKKHLRRSELDSEPIHRTDQLQLSHGWAPSQAWSDGEGGFWRSDRDPHTAYIYTTRSQRRCPSPSSILFRPIRPLTHAVLHPPRTLRQQPFASWPPTPSRRPAAATRPPRVRPHARRGDDQRPHATVYPRGTAQADVTQSVRAQELIAQYTWRTYTTDEVHMARPRVADYVGAWCLRGVTLLVVQRAAERNGPPRMGQEPAAFSDWASRTST